MNDQLRLPIAGIRDFMRTPACHTLSTCDFCFVVKFKELILAVSHVLLLVIGIEIFYGIPVDDRCHYVADY